MSFLMTSIDLFIVTSGFRYTAAAALERHIQWNDLMWPDDKSAWSSSPRHSYLQSCERHKLLPHPRLLKFPNSTLPPTAQSSITSSRLSTAIQNSFIGPFGFVAEQIFLGDAGLDASIPLIRTVLAAGGERAKQLHLINVGITHAGICSLGDHLKAWSSAPNSSMRVTDVDFSGNAMSSASAKICPIVHLQPILRTIHLQRLVLNGCK